jgi:hypothetical protein
MQREGNVGTDLPTLRNIPKQRKSHAHSGGSLKSRIGFKFVAGKHAYNCDIEASVAT